MSPHILIQRPLAFFGNSIILAILLVSMLFSFGVNAPRSAQAQDDDQAQECGKPRTVVMHDPELDDQNTLIRYLLYSNEFDTQALVYQSGRYHWKGDGQGTPYTGEVSEHLGLGITDPVSNWRWDEDERFIEDTVDAYAEVYPNLSVHAEGYPDPDELRSRIIVGNIEFPGDISKDSPGSDLIKSLLLDDNPCPVWLLTGAGQSTIGRALLSIEEEYKDTDESDAIYEKVSKKAIISSFGDQDDVYANYIGPNWPDIEFREMSTTIWGYLANRAVLTRDAQYLSTAWTQANVSEVGPLGALYRVWGDGKQMAEGDPVDFFGFNGLTGDQITRLGYSCWFCNFGLELGEPGSWISEGDTSMWMNLLDNGLEGDVDASYGGWGGRNADDINPATGEADENYASTRWFGAAQRDFAARLQWSVTPNYEDANHKPVVEVAELETTVLPGETVTLTGMATDPDGDHLVGRWWQYAEAGTYPGQLELAAVGEEPLPEFTYREDLPGPGDPAIDALIEAEIEKTVEFTVPDDAEAGQTLHLIFEVTDMGSPNLTSYQRVVLTVGE